MNKKEEILYDQNKTEKPSRGKKKGLKPHHLKKQILLNNLYYSVHKEDLEKTLQELNMELSKAGITLTADEYTALTIDIDQDKMTVLTTRKAGRKKKRSGVLYEQVMEYAKTHTSMEVAEWLGLTRQTYYRKLKTHREEQHDGSIEFGLILISTFGWHYSSVYVVKVIDKETKTEYYNSDLIKQLNMKHIPDMQTSAIGMVADFFKQTLRDTGNQVLALPSAYPQESDYLKKIFEHMFWFGRVSILLTFSVK